MDQFDQKKIDLGNKCYYCQKIILGHSQVCHGHYIPFIWDNVLHGLEGPEEDVQRGEFEEAGSGFDWTTVDGFDWDGDEDVDVDVDGDGDGDGDEDVDGDDSKMDTE